MRSEAEARVKQFPGGWTVSAKACDSCKTAPALLFCRADSAFLCLGCDSKVHTANKLASRHERVWMCDVCEQAPASVTCKADAAALCVTCDADIHSANPLARRHERFPVVPFYEPADKSSRPLKPTLDDQDDEDDDSRDQTCREEAEAASWILTNPNPKLMEPPEFKSADFYLSDVDPYLDLDYTSSMDARFQQHNDSVVPVQTKTTLPQTTTLLFPSSTENCFEMDFSRPKPSYSYTAPSLSQSVSSSSLDVGVVPDGTDITNPFVSNGVDLSTSALSTTTTTTTTTAQASQLSTLDREARVMRYREKRKNRKFEKTIRYASRKAYAETRPRIKGRFAKRTEMDNDVDRIYSSAAAVLMAESGYGVVPSF